MLHTKDQRIVEILNNLKIIEDIHSSMEQMTSFPIKSEAISFEELIKDSELERLPTGEYLL